jgi:hypothetical protein
VKGAGRRQWVAWVSYTLLRVVFFLATWLIIQLTTPIRGVWAIALAIVISGVFSILLLSRQRDAMSGSVFGYFRRLNERIDAAAAKEDYDDPAIDGLLAEGEPHTESEPINEKDQPG